MVTKVPVPVRPGFALTQADIRKLCGVASLPIPSPDVCSGIAEALGHIARMLAQRLETMERPTQLRAEQEDAFWNAMELLEFALPGLHPLYGLMRTHTPGLTESVGGDAAFERLMGAMQVASKFVPRRPPGVRAGFDETETCARILSVYEHFFVATELTLSSTGPAVRFVREALKVVAGIERTPGAIYQRLRPIVSTPVKT